MKDGGDGCFIHCFDLESNSETEGPAYENERFSINGGCSINALKRSNLEGCLDSCELVRAFADAAKQIVDISITLRILAQRCRTGILFELDDMSTSGIRTSCLFAGYMAFYHFRTTFQTMFARNAKAL
jgi:hypothetical protein